MPSNVKAAKKNGLCDTKEEIGINWTTTIRLYNENSKATYIYTSKNKKIATVSKKGVIKGKKAGKTTIAVTQKLNNKKTKIGTVTVYIKKAYIYNYVKKDNWISNQTGWVKNVGSTFAPNEYIGYMNKKAVYKVYSSNSSKLPITTKGAVKDVKGTGEVMLTFKETYKGKTSTVGSIQVELHSPSYTGDAEVEIGKNEIFDVSEYLNAVGAYALSIYDEQTKNDELGDINDSDDDFDYDVLKSVVDADGSWDGLLKGAESGTRWIYLFTYNYNTKKYETTPFASFSITVNVVENLDKIELDFDKNTSDYSDKYTKDNDTYKMKMDNFELLKVYQSPFNYAENIEVTSSAPDVVSVSFDRCTTYDKQNGYIGKIALNPLKTGNTVITLKSANVERTFNVVVEESKYYNTDDEYFVSFALDQAIPVAYYEDGDLNLEPEDNCYISDFIYNVAGNKIIGIEACVYNDRMGKKTFTVLNKGKEIKKFTLNFEMNFDRFY